MNPSTQKMLAAICCWVPVGFLAVFWLVLTLAIRETEGLGRVTVWYVAHLAIPAVGLLVFAGAFLLVLLRRCWKSRLWIGTLLSSALTLGVGAALNFGLAPITYPADRDQTAPSATVLLPLDGPIKVGWGGDELEHNYHAAHPDQRWAYDLLIEPYMTQSSELSDFGCYGKPILAPASGRIAWVKDGLEDHPPGEVSNDYKNPTGNSLAIRLDETGTHLVLAHMRPRSLLVKEGDQVEEGQPLGECGNSGNTSEPHVHIHHQRQNPADSAHGFAEGLPLYFRNHGGKPMPIGGLEEQNGKTVATGDVVEHQVPQR